MKDKALSNRLAAFLAAIPKSNEKAIFVSELLPKVRGKKQREKILAAVDSLVLILKVFGAVKITVDRKKKAKKVKAKSEYAFYFLHSLAEYIQNDLPLISNWEKPAITESLTSESILTWGTQFLYLMEEKRIKRLGKQHPTRLVEMAQVIIKAKVRGISQPAYLVQYDHKAGRFQLIGGRRRKKDKTILSTIKREIGEELPLNKFVYGQNYRLKPLIEKVEFFNLSPTFGAFTKYTLTVYQMFVDEKKIKLGKSDRWLTASELRKGVTKDGILVASFFQHEKYFEGKYEDLPLSVKQVQQWQPKKAVAIPKKTKKKKEASEIRVHILKGESEVVEFKSSARWDFNKGALNKGLEKVIIKTIAGFLNCNGGILLIGVTDDGGVVGIDNDMKTLKRKNLDGFMQYLIDLILSYIGVEYTSYVKVSFGRIEEKHICMIKVARSTEPVFMRVGKAREFYVRAGNTTRLLDSKQVYNYIQMNW